MWAVPEIFKFEMSFNKKKIRIISISYIVLTHLKIQLKFPIHESGKICIELQQPLSSGAPCPCFKGSWLWMRALTAPAQLSINSSRASTCIVPSPIKIAAQHEEMTMASCNKRAEPTLELPWQPQEESDENRMLNLLSQWWWLGEFSG